MYSSDTDSESLPIFTGKPSAGNGIRVDIRSVCIVILLSFASIWWFFYRTTGPLPYFDHSRYHTLEEIQSYITQLDESNHPKISVELVGYSFQSRPIYAIRIGNNDQHKVLLNCNTHAREWISSATCLYMIEHIMKTERYTGVSVFIIPMLNPDGFLHSKLKSRMWRKTMQTTVKKQCQGIDIERNFPIQWESKIGIGQNPCDETYGGTRPLESVEASALVDFMKKHHPFDLMIDIHSYGMQLLHPWAFQLGKTKHYKIQEKVVEIGGRATGADYTTGQTAEILSAFQAAGGLDDWAYSKMGVICSFTMEVRPRKSSFKVPEDEIIPNGKEVARGIDAIIPLILDGTCSNFKAR